MQFEGIRAVSKAVLPQLWLAGVGGITAGAAQRYFSPASQADAVSARGAGIGPRACMVSLRRADSFGEGTRIFDASGILVDVSNKLRCTGYT